VCSVWGDPHMSWFCDVPTHLLLDIREKIRFNMAYFNTTP
jgi:hypothetical protein